MSSYEDDLVEVFSEPDTGPLVVLLKQINENQRALIEQQRLANEQQQLLLQQQKIHNAYLIRQFV